MDCCSFCLIDLAKLSFNQGLSYHPVCQSGKDAYELMRKARQAYRRTHRFADKRLYKFE